MFDFRLKIVTQEIESHRFLNKNYFRARGFELFFTCINWIFKDRPVIQPTRKIFIKGLNLITSTSPRFKKFLSPLISLDFRRNFTKCVIKCAMCIISQNPIESFSIHPSGPCWYKNFAWAVSRRLRGHQNVGRFFKCTKNISYRYLQEKSAREFFPFGF